MPAKISDEILLEKFQLYYNTYGVSPKSQDFKNCEWLSSIDLYRRRFGSMKAVRKMLNIPNPNRKKCIRDNKTKEELIYSIQKYYNEIGYPTTTDIKNCSDMPPVSQYYRKFGSWKEVLKRANIPERMEPQYKHSDKEVLELFKNFYNELECAPTKKQINENKHIPSYSLYSSRFGTMKNIYNLIGIEKPKYATDKEESLRSLMKLYCELGRIPMKKDIDLCSYTLSSGFYRDNFGSHLKALESLGIDMSKNKFQNYNDKELLLLFENFVENYLKEHRLLPSFREMDINFDNMPNSITYLRHFESRDNLYELIGYNYDEYNYLATKQDMILKFEKLFKELGRVPSLRDLARYSSLDDYYSTTTYYSFFGSMENLIKSSENIPEKYKKGALFSCNGTRCLSLLELNFCNMLEKSSLVYTKEDFYKDFICNFNRKYRFDFIIYNNGSPIFIEIFGVQGRELYNERVKEKIKLCIDNDLKLIDLYSDDIYRKSSEEIYQILQQKLLQFNIDINNIKRIKTTKNKLNYMRRRRKL